MLPGFFDDSKLRLTLAELKSPGRDMNLFCAIRSNPLLYQHFGDFSGRHASSLFL